MNKIEIKDRWTGSVLFEYEKENNTLKDTVEQAVKERADLEGADLEGAYLEGADLRGANLGGANLGDANLGDANLGGANLGGANLGDAKLGDANLGGAYLEDANLGGANLEGAYLEGAYLRGADLEGADLEGAYLEGAYIYLSDNEIKKESIIKDFEENNGIKLTETYINRNVIPTKWNCFWKYGLTICEWEVIEKEESAEENKEIEEYKTKYTERCIDIEVREKINELVRAVNKLIKEREEK